MMGSFDGVGLKEAFRRILPCIDRIEEGALFCLERNFAWTLEMEEREGRALIAEAFAAFPELAALLPERAGRITRGDLLGDAIFPSEVAAARKALGVRRRRRY